MAVHQHVHHDDVPSSSSVEEGRELKLAIALVSNSALNSKVNQVKEIKSELWRSLLEYYDRK